MHLAHTSTAHVLGCCLGRADSSPQAASYMRTSAEKTTVAFFRVPCFELKTVRIQNDNISPGSCCTREGAHRMPGSGMYLRKETCAFQSDWVNTLSWYSEAFLESSCCTCFAAPFFELAFLELCAIENELSAICSNHVSKNRVKKKYSGPLHTLKTNRLGHSSRRRGVVEAAGGPTGRAKDRTHERNEPSTSTRKVGRLHENANMT